MNLEVLEKQDGDFYVPAFKVTVGGKDLVRQLYLSVTNAEVDLKEKTSGHFSFTVANAFDWKTRAFVARKKEEEEERIELIKLFALGTQIEMSFGYGDPSELKPMLRGTVSKVSTSFSEGSIPELTVTGYDGLYRLTIGKKARHWEDARDSDVVSDLVKGSGLTTDIKKTDPQKPRIDKGQEADMVFLRKLADRNRATFSVVDNKFYFGKRNNDKSDVLELPWGKGLLTFSPNVNLARQVQSVEVRGWSATLGKHISATATRTDISGRDGARKTGAEQVASALNTKPAMVVRAAVHTQAEADVLAKSVLEERAEEFVKGTGECIGLPEIVPDMNIALTDLGKTFSKTYYVSAAKHKMDSSGYRTSFSVEETSV